MDSTDWPAQMASPTLTATAAVARAVRNGDCTAELNARRELAAAKAEHYLATTLAAAPPLTPAQRDRLAALLNGATS